jgi:hypothetical protein
MPKRAADQQTLSREVRWFVAHALSKNKNDGVSMKDNNGKKCAHIPCLCDVPDGEQYCGEACRDASSEDVEIACQCDHASCPLVA